MSFALTTRQVRRRQKTVTRRKGWRDLKPGQHVLAVEKCQGLKRGERQVVLAELVVVAVRREKLSSMTERELLLEGFPGMTRVDFFALYCKANGGHASQLCTRIEFRYAEPEERQWSGWFN